MITWRVGIVEGVEEHHVPIVNSMQEVDRQAKVASD